MTEKVKHVFNGVPVVTTASQRTFQLWHSSDKKFIQYRNYATERRAQDQGLLWCKWELKVGQSLEIVDVRTWRHLGTYTRRITGMEFKGGAAKVTPATN